ncbi:hypothetical protein SAMN04490194_1084 [Pseudomonas migulae]|uniref:Uncharacterized protein n=1 Tax=Pseudomonas migulae TaxID=78543 RepID=A0A1H5G997_9PSED|nr:hypothetical protein FBY04_10381 [Pseudomonas sp. SJZ080]SEE12293.1 hypothetical protein SAMN04490194_1084 [Pseudomonas migulae]
MGEMTGLCMAWVLVVDRDRVDIRFFGEGGY